jgi:acylaminoacyl-peptidase
LTTSFSVACFTFLSQGLSILLVNYTGSTGFGDDSIYGLVGKIGVLEVSEVHEAALWAKTESKAAKVFVHGGSHGGFIASHLVSQYPDLYAGAVIRNPVINVGGMPFDTDIPGF